MKLRYKTRWFVIATVISAALVVVVLVRGMPPRPPFHVGSTMKEVRTYLEDEDKHERHLPPFKQTSLVYGGGGTSAWIVRTEFSLRAGHVFARRYVSVDFSTNGLVKSIGSRWKWSWSI